MMKMTWWWLGMIPGSKFNLPISKWCYILVWRTFLNPSLAILFDWNVKRTLVHPTRSLSQKRTVYDMLRNKLNLFFSSSTIHQTVSIIIGRMINRNEILGKFGKNLIVIFMIQCKCEFCYWFLLILWTFNCSEFCSMVRKIFIYTSEEVRKLSPKIKLPVNDDDADSKATKAGVDTVINPEDRSLIVGQGC